MNRVLLMEGASSAVTHPSERRFPRASAGCHPVRLVKEIAIMREAAQTTLPLLVALVAYRIQCRLGLHDLDAGHVNVGLVPHLGHG